MNKLCRIKFIPFEKLRNLNAAIWIETSLNLTGSSAFSARFKILYDDALTCMTSKPLANNVSYRDLLDSLIDEFEAADMLLCDTYAYTRDSFRIKKEEEKLNKGIDLFKNIVFIPAKLRHANSFLYSFYILQP